jgi:hypothetical protein
VPEYDRIATFEADAAAVDAVLSEINASDGAPEGVPAKRITVYANRDTGRAAFTVRFGSKEDLRIGSETLDAMSPPEGGTMRRLSVESYEVVLERDA